MEDKPRLYEARANAHQPRFHSYRIEQIKSLMVAQSAFGQLQRQRDFVNDITRLNLTDRWRKEINQSGCRHTAGLVIDGKVGFTQG